MIKKNENKNNHESNKNCIEKKTAEIYRNRVLIGSAIFLLIRAKAVKTGKKEIFCNNTMFKGIVFFSILVTIPSYVSYIPD